MEHARLEALADFNLVARHGGFGRAARASGRPKATLSRRIADLEAALGVRLFERSTRALQLTQEGRALFEKASVLLLELEEATGALAAGGQAPRGRLRISAPLLFSQAAMGRLAARFARAHPEVQLEVTSEDRPVDMVEEGYDLVIRVNPDPDANLVGRVFLRDRLVVVAGPALPRPSDGSPVPVVVRGAVREGGAAVWELAGPTSLAVWPVLGLSSLFMVRDAVLEHVGAARLPLSLVATALADGRLVHWGDVPGPATELWALYPSRRLLSARVAAFLQFLQEAFPNGTPDELAAFVG